MIIQMQQNNNIPDEDAVKCNSLKAWFLAARPKTLSAACVPVMIGASFVWKDIESFRPIPTPDLWYLPFVLVTAICFLFAMVMQIDANFINDYFDCVRGNDDETRLGPKRACAMGWVSLKAMRWAIAITTLLACLIGLPVGILTLASGDWTLMIVGVACVIFCFLYTTCLSYLGLGDLLVLVFFGLVPVYCTYYLLSGDNANLDVYLMALATGLVVDTLLIINNYRDIDNDRCAGKRTLAVLMGRKNTMMLYNCIVPVALCITLYVSPTMLTYAAMFIVYMLHIQTCQKMKQIGQGRELNKVLGLTARNIFVYGILVTLCIIL